MTMESTDESAPSSFPGEGRAETQKKERRRGQSASTQSEHTNARAWLRSNLQSLQLLSSIFDWKLDRFGVSICQNSSHSQRVS